MGKKDEDLKCLIKGIMQLIAADTLSFEIDPNAELPEHIRVFALHGCLNGDGIKNNIYTGYTLKFGVIGTDQREEMDKRFKKLYDVLSELRKEI